MATNNEFKVKPLGDRVIVRIEEQDEMVSPGGIILPETTRERPQEGVIVAVGQGEVETYLKKGQKVLFGRYSGTEIEDDSNDLTYLVLRFEDVLGIVLD